ncbi:hypothetical protein ACFL2W_00920 [Candidatus Omnitrophota bacterium]
MPSDKVLFILLLANASLFFLLKDKGVVRINSVQFYFILFIVTFVIVYLRDRNKLGKRRKDQIEKGAEDIVSVMKKSFVEEHEMGMVSPQDFPKRDISFYDLKRRQLQDLGFIYLADVEDVTLSEAYPQTRTFIRIMLSDDGCGHAGIYDATPGVLRSLFYWLLGARGFKNVDIETELENGLFVITTTAPVMFSHGPQIVFNRVPRRATVKELVQAHKKNVSEQINRDNIKPLKFKDLGDVLNSQKRQHEIIHVHRKSIGYGLTRDEKNKFGKGLLGGGAGKVFSRVDELAEDEKAADAAGPSGSNIEQEENTREEE